jgi:hypothetical protein
LLVVLECEIELSGFAIGIAQVVLDVRIVGAAERG